MIRDSGVETADACVLDELSVGDLDADAIRRYRILFDNLRPGHIWSRLPDEAFLVKIGAAKKLRDGTVRPNLAGLVCFGDFSTISDILPCYFLDYREHGRTDVRWTDRVCSGDATWSGNILDFYFRIYDRLTSDVKVPFKLDEHSQRVNETKVHDVLREVLANALIHADYHGRRGIVIDKCPDWMDVSNPEALRNLF